MPATDTNFWTRPPRGLRSATAILHALPPRQQVVCLHTGLLMLRPKVEEELRTTGQPAYGPWPRPPRALLQDDPDSLVCWYLRRKRPATMRGQINRLESGARGAAVRTFGAAVTADAPLPKAVFASLHVVLAITAAIDYGYAPDGEGPQFLPPGLDSDEFPESLEMTVGMTGAEMATAIAPHLERWWVLCQQKLPVHDATHAHLTWWMSAVETCGCVQGKADRNCRWCGGSGKPDPDYQTA